MKTDNLITIHEFCTSHNIESSFISSLQQYGLIEITTIQKTEFIDINQLRDLEKMVRFHYELDINLEGIETIIHLLERINAMDEEIITFRNRLRFYEASE
jgi:hypothetical protein